MREPEGIETPLPGKSSERAWSKDRESYIRNVEAEGSSPFTSTKGQVTGLKWDPPQNHRALRVAWVEVVAPKRSASRMDRKCGIPGFVPVADQRFANSPDQ